MQPTSKPCVGDDECAVQDEPTPETAATPSPRIGKDLILATKPFAEDDSARSWWYVISTLTLLGGGLLGTMALEHPLVRGLASVLTGLLALRFFVIYHDHQHHALLPNSRAADAMMWLYGIWALSPSSIWQSSHNHHHSHNSRLRGSNIGSFPIMTADAFSQASSRTRFGYLFSRHPLTMLFGYVFVFLFGMCLNPFISRPGRHWDCLVALVLHGLIALALFTWGGWQAVVFTQTIPSLVLYSIGSYLFYAQHNFPAVKFHDHAGWTYEGAALESSSYMRLNKVMAWFTANIGYHHIHHLNAKIPFYRLPEAMRGIPELQSPRCTSLVPTEVWRCLRLKVWDVSEQKMTSLPKRSSPARRS